MIARCWPVALSIATVAACNLPSIHGQRIPELAWEVPVTLDDEGRPRVGSISLRVGKQSVLLIRHPTSGCRELKPREYFFHDIPDYAVSAASGVRHGRGEDLYVTFEDGWIRIFHRTVREKDPIPEYRLLKEIPPLI